MARALTPNILIGHCDLISRFSDFALYSPVAISITWKMVPHEILLWFPVH